MTDTIISVKNLTKRYNGVTAVHDISFSVNKGEVFGLLGPNGAGKTTTLECLEGLKKTDGGTLSVAGYDPGQQARSLPHVLGVQLQTSSLPDYMLPSEAMQLICSWHSVPCRSDLLTLYGLDRDHHKPYRSLSTGQKRRLHLALALACNPSVVILDEPTAGLDVQGRAQLHEAIRELKRQGVTLMLATHDMAEAESLCDRIAILIRGQLAVIATPAQITATARQETRIWLRTSNGSLLPGQDRSQAVFIRQTEDYGIWQAKDAAAAVIELLNDVQKSGDRVEDLRVERPSLEEAFLSMIEGG
ncbi:MAG: ABC transporter ATP-binding protein [Bacillota bacterium]|nr:ABC transporter ATP-binding protein [Bacillota bacterium]